MKIFFIFSFFFFFSFISCHVNGQTWQKTYGGSSSNEHVTTILTTSDNGFIISGYTDGFGASGKEVLLMKIDSFGNVQWAKKYGAINDDFAQCANKTNDGGYILAGHTESFGLFGQGAYLNKVDSSGNLQWSKSYTLFGGDTIRSVLQTKNNGYILVGKSSGNNSSFFINTSRGSAITMNNISVNFIEQTTDGGYILTGKNLDTFGTNKYGVLFLKLDSNLFWKWGKTIGDTDEVNNGRMVHQTFDGGYIITGQAHSIIGGLDIFLTKTDNSGNVQWTKTYGGIADEGAWSIEITSDNGYLVSGSTNSFGAGNQDIFVMKTDDNGNLQWFKTYGGTAAENVEGNCLSLTSDNGIVIAANTSSFGTTNDIYIIKSKWNGSSGCNDTSITPSINSVSWTAQKLNSPGGSFGGDNDDVALTSVYSVSFTENILCFDTCQNNTFTKPKINVEFPKQKCYPLIVNFSADTVAGVAIKNLQWNLGDGTIINDQKNLTHIYYKNKKIKYPFEYKIILQTEYKNGCINSDTISIEVCEDIFIPNVFSPNGDGSNDEFFIKGISENNCKLIIFNRWGQKVFEEKNYQDKNNWDGKDKNGNKLASGVYFYNLYCNDGIRKGWVEVIY